MSKAIKTSIPPWVPRPSTAEEITTKEQLRRLAREFGVDRKQRGWGSISSLMMAIEYDNRGSKVSDFRVVILKGDKEAEIGLQTLFELAGE